jgi:serine/threonine protein phosphatase 1
MITIRRDRRRPRPGVTIEERPIYAIGDIHGRYDLLRTLLAQIATDAASRASGKRTLLIFLGDYVDRGPDTRKVLDALVWLTRSGAIEVRLLQGNHEAMLASFLAYPVRHAP